MTTSATEPPSPDPSAAARPDAPAARVPRQQRDRSPRSAAQPAASPERPPAARPAKARPARREPEPLAPTPPEQLGDGLYPFLDRFATLLRDIARDTGDTFRFVLIVLALLVAVLGAVAAVAVVLHNPSLAAVGGAGTLLLTGWGVARTARANRRRRQGPGTASGTRAARSGRPRP